MANSSKHPETGQNTPEPNQTTEEMLAEFHRLVEHGRRRWKSLIIVEALSLAVAAPLAYLLLIFLIDNVIHLPVWGLVVANLLFFACLIWMVRRLVVSWRKARFTEDQVALAIEKRTEGGFENRLINALQVARGDAAGEKALSKAVVGENYRFLKQIQLQQSSESRPVVLRAMVAVAVVCAAVAFWTYGQERFATSAARLFMPLAGIEPVYRTLLDVQPGDVTIDPGEDVTVTVQVEGRVPEHLLLLIDDGQRQTSREVPVDPETSQAVYLFESNQKSLTYRLRGGDYRTPAYQITVPDQLELLALRAAVTYPDYTGLGTAELESGTGDLQVLAGSEAELSFEFNQPFEEVWLVAGEPGADRETFEEVEMIRRGDQTFSRSHSFDTDVEYSLRARRPGGALVEAEGGRLRATPDLPPDVDLAGVPAESEIMLEDVLELTVRASDDYGLVKTGIFWRTAGNGTGEETEKGPWQPVRTWALAEELPDSFRTEEAMLLAALEVAEGDRIELAGRARDAHPDRAEGWTTGPAYPIVATSPGAALQLAYERILRSEAQIEALIDAQEQLEQKTGQWLSKMDADSEVRWDSEENIGPLREAVAELAKVQADIRSQVGQVARDLPEQAGDNMRVGLGMLADTEMVRNIRLLERVPERDTPRDMRASLADSRLTADRTLRSLNEIRQRYVQFRENWELDHMISFTEMLALRQERMAEGSLAYAGLSEDALAEEQRQSITRRQEVLQHLAGLAQEAFAGLARRGDEVGSILATAFEQAETEYRDEAFQGALTEAVDHLNGAMWILAEIPQRQSADHLADIYRNLRLAQTEVAREALEALENLAERSEKAAQELADLREGFSESTIDMGEELELVDAMRIMEVTRDLEAEMEEPRTQERFVDYEEHMEEFMTAEEEMGTVDTATHTLPDYFQPDEDRTAVDLQPEPFRNPAESTIQEELVDVVGDLIEEAEELRADYATFLATISKRVLDTGEVARDTLDPLSSTGATAVTGNQPPPSDDVGGVARVGRLGARAHGEVAGDHMINRRGREPLDGQDQVPEQEGMLEETLSDDTQEEASTGIGGKQVDSENNHYSAQDDGEWREDMLDQLEEPQEIHKIVEREGEALPPELAERMRDMDHREEQLIERIKTVKKEFDELFLPSGHLDDLLDRMRENHDRLKEAPELALVRERLDLLDHLQASVIVFNRPSAEFAQSLPRQPRVLNSILDEKAAQAFPGYEDAVDRYYRRLADLEDPR